MDKQIKICIIVLVVLLVAAGYLNFLYKELYPQPPQPEAPEVSLTGEPPELEDFKKFSSEQEFKAYLEESQLKYAEGLGGGFGFAAGRGGLIETDVQIAEKAAPWPAEAESPERVSETTVQVAGIDEPDIVKTDGQRIYFSSGPIFYQRKFIGMVPPVEAKGATKVIKAFPPADLAVEAEIKEGEALLLYKNILIIFSAGKIYGYDVSSPAKPEKKWTIELDEKNYFLAGRLSQDKLYLTTKTALNTFKPCPIEPLKVNETALVVKCGDIYHPSISLPVDVTFNVFLVEPSSGEIERTVSFVGGSDASVVYMSGNAIYLTFSYFGDFTGFAYNFLSEKAKDLMPADILKRLEKLTSYDISAAAKLVELQLVLDNYFNSLGSDETLRIQNELTNRMKDYYQMRKRELEKTGIVKIALADFAIKATGNVPGQPLNQFSLDEYENHLRLATTVGQSSFGFRMFSAGGESANDVYVLDNELKIKGKLQDLALKERIYSARFIEDKGYLVTFRQIDPFFVLDLSRPETPELKGELKIPGYSSYLHPITKSQILGIGKEENYVKISLFDVENPENPREAAKYTLDEYWSDILNTHHAFLLDKKHEIFFLPGSKGGYIFSYREKQLQMVKAVSNIAARRALYINDYLYIIGDDELAVLSELDWQRVNRLAF